MRKLTLMILMFAATSAAAQQIDLKSLDKFAEKAKEVVEINMDESMLKSASGMLSEKTGDEAAAKKVTEGLKGIYGRVFEFGSTGVYTRGDLDSVRNQLKTPQWTAFVRVNSKEDGEEVELWMHRTNGVMDGMFMLVAGRNELVVFNLIGMTRLEDLAKIGGQFGIPRIGGAPKK